MKIGFSVTSSYEPKDWFFMLTPSIGTGYCEKYLHVTLYFLVWEFSVEFDWEG